VSKTNVIKTNFDFEMFKPLLLKRSGLYCIYYCFLLGNFVYVSCYMRNIPYSIFLVSLKTRGVINDSNIEDN
jgi:hypothetical protein